MFQSNLSVDAGGILKAIKSALLSLKNSTNITETDEEYFNKIWLKLINANFDGASVMSGNVSGVQARLKKLQPGLIYTHCIAHKLELAVLDAMKRNDSAYLNSFDENINGIFHFYYYSTVRRKELKQVAELLKDEFKQLGRLKNIRWLSSRSRALCVLETNYKVLNFDLESKSYGNDETAKKALGYLKFITTPKFLSYLNFLQDLVAVLKTLSLQFQKDSLLACEVSRKLEENCAVMDALSIVPGEYLTRLMKEMTVKQEQNNDLVYKEVILTKECGRRDEDIPHNPQSYMDHFSVTFNRVIEETQRFIWKRFAEYKQEPLNQMTSIFDFKVWPKTFKGSILEKKWGLEDLEMLTDWYYKRNYITEEEKKLAVQTLVAFSKKNFET